MVIETNLGCENTSPGAKEYVFEKKNFRPGPGHLGQKTCHAEISAQNYGASLRQKDQI